MTQDAVRGRSFTFSHSATRGRVLPSIDLLADVLDPRLTYTRAGNLMYWANDGTLKQAAANVWPIEYVDGRKAGRHQPEPEATNYQVYGRAIAPADDTHVVRTTPMDPAAAGAPDGGAIARLPLDCDAYGFSQDIGGADLWPITLYTGHTAKWQRVVMPVTSTNSSRLRTWMGRNKANGPPVVYLTQGAYMSANDWTASYFHKAYDDTSFLGGLVQLERGKVATSPIITEGNATVARSAAALTIATMGARGCRVVFSNGDVEPYWFAAGATFTLPTSARNWAERYMARIEYF